MDTLSHGLWGGLAFGRKNKPKFWLFFLFGMMPDLLSFGIFMVGSIVGFFSRPLFSNGHPPDANQFPVFLDIMYNITHSIFIFLLIFIIIWLILRKPFLPILAWGLHILMDIPTHSYEFFPTPFLWPFSNFKVNGLSWGEPYIMIPNVILLIILFSYFYIFKKKKSKNSN